MEPLILTAHMTRVEEAIRSNLGSNVNVLAVVPKDTIEREGYWERRFVAAFERHHGPNTVRPLPVDYGTITVCIDSRGDTLVHDGWYDRVNARHALQDMLGRTYQATTLIPVT